MQDLTKQLPDSNAPLKQVIQDAASTHNVNPAFLASSISPQEGMYSGDDNFPVHGAEHFGIDSHNIPDGIDHDKGIAVVNGKDVPSANFKTVEDAATAKAFQLRQSLDNIKDQAAKRGATINDNTAQFIAHAGENGKKMLNGYADNKVLNDNIVNQKPDVGYGKIYDNAKQGYDNAQSYNEHFEGTNPTEITPDIMNKWNNLQKWVKDKGYAGKEELDRDPELRNKVFKEYNKENPNSTIDPSIVQPVQNEMQKYKQWVLDGLKNKSTSLAEGTNESNFMKDLSKVDGIYGKYTSQWSFPPKYMETIFNGKKIKRENEGLSTRNTASK